MFIIIKSHKQEGVVQKFMNKPITTTIICPRCKSQLDIKEKVARCNKCSNTYPIENGVLRFLDKNDGFYENVYVRQIHYVPGNNFLKNWVYFNLVQCGILGEIKKAINPRDRVLDVGCAGGIRWLGKYAETIGVDLSLASLIKATECYVGAIQTNIESLPFQNDIFDLIYGSYIYEHLSNESKTSFLEEAWRILKPGGKLILQFDTLSNNWLTKFALKNKGAYEKSFIATDGHIGLEPLTSAIKRLESAGFKTLKSIKFGTTLIQYQATYGWLNAAYGKDYFLIRWTSKLVNMILSTPPGIVLEFAITIFDRAINRFSKPDAATRAIVILEKI